MQLRTGARSGGRGNRCRALRAAAAVVLLSVTACEIPTSPPRFVARYLVAGTTTALEVSQLLPAAVTVTQDGAAFRTAVGGIVIDRSLGDLCPPCIPFAGVVVPKPAFTAQLPGSAQLPAEVVSATLASGSIEVRVENRLNFDPIRPSGTARGRLLVEIASAGRVLGGAVVEGTAEALPPNGTLSRTITLAPGTVTSPLTIVVTVESPAGDPVTVDPNGRLIVTVPASQFTVSDAVVNVAARTVQLDAVSIDLRDVDDLVRERVRGGAIVLDIANPFAVTGQLELVATGGGIRVARPVGLSSGGHRLELSEAELRSLLGSLVTISVAGPIDATPAVTVRPNDRVSVAARLEIALEVGGRGDR